MDERDLKREIDRLTIRMARLERQMGIAEGASDFASDQDSELAALASNVEPPPVRQPVATTTLPPIAPSPSVQRVEDQSKSETFARLKSDWSGHPALRPSVQPQGLPPSAPQVAPPTAPSTIPPMAPPVAARVTIPPLAPPVVARSTPPIVPPVAPPIGPRGPGIAPGPAAGRSGDYFAARTAPAARADHTGTSIEMAIGGKWLAWIGAIVVLLAVAFLIMLGVERGWWGNLHPGVRFAGIAVFGALLLAGGEIALRKIGKAASVGLFGAGLGTLYLDAYAAFQPFGIVGEIGAFPLLGAVALLGFAITIRTRFLTIGVLSLVGGYLAPLMLWRSLSGELWLPLYLTMLFGIALGLSAVQAQHFRALRYVSLGGQIVVALIWIVSEMPGVWKPAMVFISIWAVMLLAEVVHAALREQSTAGNVIASLLGTASFVTAGCWLLDQPATADLMGIFTLMVGVLNAAAAFQFGPGLDALRERAYTTSNSPAPITFATSPKTYQGSAMDTLAIALWIQAAVLLVTAVALHFDGFGQTVSWLSIGVAAIEIGRRLPSRGVTRFGLIVGGLAVLRVTFVDWWPASMRNSFYSIGQIHISGWSILAVATILAMHAAAQRLMVKVRSADRLPSVLTALAMILWLILCIAQCSDLTETAGWLAGAAALLALRRFGERQKYFQIGMAILVATAVRWLVIDALASRVNPRWNAADSLPLLNWQMALAVAIAACGWWAYRITRARAIERAGGAQAVDTNTGIGWQVVLMIGSIFGLIAMSFEVDRLVERLGAAGSIASVSQTRQLLLTMLWTAGAAGVGLFAAALGTRDEDGRVDVPRVLVRFAWSVLAICAVKWVIGDSLYFWAMGPTSSRGMVPLVNLQMVAGLLVAASAVFFTVIGVTPIQSRPDRSMRTGLTQWIPVGTAFMVLWGLSFEVDHALVRFAPQPHWMDVWSADQLRCLLWTALWSAGGIGMMAIARWRKLQGLMMGGWMVAAGAAMAWLTVDTIIFRLNDGLVRAAVVFNLQFFVGVLSAIVLAMASRMYWVSLREDGMNGSLENRNLGREFGLAFAMIGAIGLWLGTLEIDRAFIDSPMSRQTGFSVYWGIYAVFLVMLGLVKRVAMARYVGLGLLAITLCKAFIVDMAEVDKLLKTVIFFVIGMLLIGTSMVYVRVAPKLLREREVSDAEA